MPDTKSNAEIAQGIVVPLADAIALSGNGKWLEGRIVRALSTAQAELAREVIAEVVRYKGHLMLGEEITNRMRDLFTRLGIKIEESKHG